MPSEKTERTKMTAAESDARERRIVSALRAGLGNKLLQQRWPKLRRDQINALRAKYNIPARELHRDWR